MPMNHLEMLEKRIKLEKSVREFFWSLNYQEVRTPMLVESPGMEPHIRPMEVLRAPGSPRAFLPTSPEFGMKKLLALGLPRIFQICSSFRDEPSSPEHHPEFTLLEFYETHCSLEELQGRVEALVEALILSLGRTVSHPLPSFEHQRPWRRFRVPDLFQAHLGVDLRSTPEAADLSRICNHYGLGASPEESWDDLYFKLWLNLIEPKLPTHEAFFITHYPLSQSSLCNPIKDERGFSWGNRFEFYIGRTELGNAFDELRDPETQRQNFKKDQEIRAKTYGADWPTSPIDEFLLRALPNLPPTSGIAIGLDRLFMVLLGLKTIDEVLFLKSHA